MAGLQRSNRPFFVPIRLSMKKISLLTSLLFPAAALLAQPDKKMVDEAKSSKKIEADTSKKGEWKIGGSLLVNFSQQNSSYWIGATEDFAMTLGGAANLYANQVCNGHYWDNTLKTNYGLVRNKSQGRRKTSDFIDLYSKYGHYINNSHTLAIAGILNARSQFTNGYDYSDSIKRRTSGFFAPANVLITPGLEWRPASYFNLFASPAAARWVIVSNRPYSYSYPGGIRPDGSQQQPISKAYGVDPAQKVDIQFGAFASASFNKDIIKNVNYTSRLDFYSDYLHNPQCVDVFWTNALLFKVNKWLGLSYSWNLAYDDDYRPAGQSGPRTQFLGTFGAGITGKF